MQLLGCITHWCRNEGLGQSVYKMRMVVVVAGGAIRKMEHGCGNDEQCIIDGLM